MAPSSEALNEQRTLLRLRGAGSERARDVAPDVAVTLLTLGTKRTLYPHAGRGAAVPGQGA